LNFLGIFDIYFWCWNKFYAFFFKFSKKPVIYRLPKISVIFGSTATVTDFQLPAFTVTDFRSVVHYRLTLAKTLINH
jgi:hypothetical protein